MRTQTAYNTALFSSARHRSVAHALVQHDPTHKPSRRMLRCIVVAHPPNTRHGVATRNARRNDNSVSRALPLRRDGTHGGVCRVVEERKHAALSDLRRDAVHRAVQRHRVNHSNRSADRYQRYNRLNLLIHLTEVIARTHLQGVIEGGGSIIAAADPEL